MGVMKQRYLILNIGLQRKEGYEIISRLAEPEWGIRDDNIQIGIGTTSKKRKLTSKSFSTAQQKPAMPPNQVTIHHGEISL